MENASQALIIAGAILLAILIIAIGMYIYNSAQSNITGALENMSTQEIEAFNNQFEGYKGQQTGSQVSALIGRLIANANTYRDEPLKVPAVQIKGKVSNSCVSCMANSTTNHANAGNQQPYISNLAKIKNIVENKHTYTISFEYHDTGVINKIIIAYDK